MFCLGGCILSQQWTLYFKQNLVAVWLIEQFMCDTSVLCIVKCLNGLSWILVFLREQIHCAGLSPHPSTELLVLLHPFSGLFSRTTWV